MAPGRIAKKDDAQGRAAIRQVMQGLRNEGRSAASKRVAKAAKRGFGAVVELGKKGRKLEPVS
jgi:hypothetical protein